jgi:hypothetical protein
MNATVSSLPPPGSGRRSRGKAIAVVGMVVLFIVPAAMAFLNKFMKFVGTVGTDEMGGAALVPMLNYLMVAAGFICLMVWAAASGMFRDVEAPKHKMLETEEKLDRAAGFREGS